MVTPQSQMSIATTKTVSQ